MDLKINYYFFFSWYIKIFFMLISIPRLTNEFTNSFISIIDETPDIQVGGLYDQLVTLVTQSHATYYGDETIKTVEISNFFGLPNKKMTLNSRAASKETISQREASEMALQFLTHHKQTIN